MALFFPATSAAIVVSPQRHAALVRRTPSANTYRKPGISIPAMWGGGQEEVLGIKC